MLCKFCNQEVEDTAKVCPLCGKSLEEEISEEIEVTPAAENDDEQVAAQPIEKPGVETESEAAEDDESEEKQLENVESEEDESEEDASEQKRGVLPLVLSIIAAVAALGALAVVLLMAMGVDLKPRANDIHYRDAYTVSAEKSEKKSHVVVATMGGKELTNVQLQLYYRMQVMDFLSYYGSYASQMGLDYTKPLSEQTCSVDEELTWEQYMINAAIENWKSYQAMALLAEEAGFQLDAEWQETLDRIPEDLKAQAEQDGYESVDALLKEVIGPGCTLDDYLEYVRLACMSNAYYMHIEETLKPTEADVEAYYAENAATLAQNGISKDMGMISDVRHILIMPKGGVISEQTGQNVYSDEEKAAAKAEAERILQEWKDGEATEDSFGLLANTYSEDGGSNTTGGLYEDIAPGANYVESFLNWSIDMNRQVGDADIVETEYGYHIMYYVGGEPYWFGLVETRLFDERVNDLTEGAKEKWPAKINFKRIFLAELKFS